MQRLLILYVADVAIAVPIVTLSLSVVQKMQEWYRSRRGAARLTDPDDHRNTLPELDTTNLWYRTYCVLKKKIVAREFGSDAKLSIPDIAEQLKVSRTPVRDALNRLELEGLVNTRPKVGTFVVPIDEKTVCEAIDSRLMIELWVAGKLARLPQSDVDGLVDKLGTILQNARKAMKTAAAAYHEQDFNLQFHMAFVDAGDNALNSKAYSAALRYRLPTTAPGRVDSDEIESAMQQHAEIIAALKDADYPRLERVLRLHLEESKARIIAKVRKSGGRL